jgi:two-component system, cell cycle sensor histidine kinase and response regulator CckA
MTSFPLKVAAYYAGFATLWIVGSDHVVGLLFPGEGMLPQTLKGWAFVLVTAFLLWVVLQNETRRRTTVESLLKESETRMRVLLESVAIGIGVETPDGRTIEANRGLARMLGYTPEEILNMRFTEYTHPDYAGLDAELFKEMVEGKRRSYQLEKRYIRKDGEIVWGRLTRSVVLDEEGRAKYCLGMLEDITDRKLADAAQRESEGRFAKAFHSSPAPMTISRIDDGLIIDVNAQWLEMIGFAREDVIGKTAAELGRWSELGRRAALIDRLRREGSVRDFETAVLTIDDKERAVIIAAETIELHGEERLLLVFHDITERKAMESRLLQARKMEAVGQLAGGIAHDFNNLLQVIQSSIDLARRNLDPEDRSRQFLDHAIRAIRRGAQLTQRLISFSGRQNLHPETVNPDKVIEGMLELVKRTLGEDIEIETAFEEGLPACVIDPHALENAILNIALNARAAMPDGGRLSVRAGRKRLEQRIKTEDGYLPEGNYVEIRLTDTGIGMSPEVAERAFEPFFTTKEVGEGTGLGLSMVYGFALQSDGYADIHSQPGRGTSVRMLLPVARD